MRKLTATCLGLALIFSQAFSQSVRVVGPTKNGGGNSKPQEPGSSNRFGKWVVKSDAEVENGIIAEIRRLAVSSAPTSRNTSRTGDGTFTNPLPGAPVTHGEAAHERKYGGRTSAIDLGAKIGTPIKAVDSGEVKRIVPLRDGRGRISRCGNGLIFENSRWQFTYCHFNKPAAKWNPVTKLWVPLQVGDVIKEGDYIATVGATGSRVTGPHLHIEVKKRTCATCPLKSVRFSSLPMDDPVDAP